MILKLLHKNALQLQACWLLSLRTCFEPSWHTLMMC